MTLTAAEVFRDYDLDGVPASGAHKPLKPEIRALLSGYESIIDSFLASGGLIYVSKATLDADISQPANSMAWVIGDAVAANNGIYRKIGGVGAGSWSRVADLPYSVIPLINVAGTGNAITATSVLPIPSGSYSALIVMTVTSANTSAATLSVNAEAAKPLLDKRGNALQSGDLAPGDILIFFKVGSTYRLIFERDFAALAADAAQAASDAEAARDIAAGYASSAVSQGNVPIYSTVVGLSALTIPAGIIAITLRGYSAAGDLGGWPLAIRVASQPSHAGRVRSNDRFLPNGSTDNTNGGWWALVTDRANPHQFGAVGDDATDDTTAIQNCLDFSLNVEFFGKTYKLSDHLALGSGHNVALMGGTTLKQYTDDKNIFKAVTKDRVVIRLNGATLFGKGNYSNAWGGMGGHEDRGVQFVNCTNSAVVGPGRIRNCSSAGVAILGGNGVGVIGSVKIEGTHTLGAPLVSGDNFQCGIYILDHASYGGAARNITIESVEISGVAQGALIETYPLVSIDDRSIRFLNPIIRDIPGQHCFYIQGGGVSITQAQLRNIALAGVKVQSSADNNQHIRNIVAIGVSAYNLLSNVFEIASLGAGSVADILLSATGNAVAVGLNTVGAVSRLKCDLKLSNVTSNAVSIQGSGPKNFDVSVDAENVGQDGVLVTATSASNLRIRASLAQCNTANDGTSCGIRVASASANVDLYDPRVSDTGGLMNYGLFNQNAGSIVKVYGSAVFTGAKDTAVRASGVIAEWPTDTTLSGANGLFTSLGNVRSSQPMKCRIESVSATNVALWSRTLDDESSYKITAEVNGKVSGSSQRKMLRSSVLVYRDNGGNATIEGTEQLSEVVASGSFGGNVAWSISGSTVSLVVNSGGSASYEWSARVQVIDKF